MDHLSGDELGDCESDDVVAGPEVGDDPARLVDGQPVGLGAQAEDDLVAVDGVDVEVVSRAADPSQKGSCGLVIEDLLPDWGVPPATGLPR